jgi:amidophosphoribosyltransferase
VEITHMCGIVGLFAKTPAFEARLGHYLAPMLLEMTDRGPDSAGVAIYRNAVPEDQVKLTVLATASPFDWQAFEADLRAAFPAVTGCARIGNHAVITARAGSAAITDWLRDAWPLVRVNSAGRAIEIYKQKGLPAEVARNFGVADFVGSHALAHTRMATESAVTTEHSHPFSTGEDLCLVHNGSLSNHNRLRTQLEKRGVRFTTDNDSEVAAGYLTWRLREGDALEEALERAKAELDGFYTFAIGTRGGFAVLRDPIACKPAVIAETDDWVAMSSEFRALAVLPGANEAESWEPAPGRIYAWNH